MSRSRPRRPARPTSPRPPDPSDVVASSPRPRREVKALGWAVALLAAVFLVYGPALGAGFIWDDDAHVTKPALTSLAGLWQIWTRLGATQQYYPGLHSFFWLQHACFGTAPAGYHFVNIALHAMNALLLVLVLQRLQVRGAWIAGSLFALHPVMVESVAWITEQKNTLSTALFLGAFLAWLRFDATRARRWYAAAALCFLAALTCKTVTATFPAALLVVLWWKRGSLAWRHDILPLAPFFAAGIAAGLFTAWVEWNLIGARGDEFDLSALERVVLAGRVIAFYAGKLVWPHELCFNYPRWSVDAGDPAQLLFPVAVAIVLAALWLVRHRTRGPLAAALLFIGTLFPVLGFLNVYPFRFSFVADHFQYLPAAAVFALAGAGFATLEKAGERWGFPRAARIAPALLLLLGLAALSWRQSRIYADEETLYRDTLAKNPAAWMAQLNLGMRLAQSGRDEEAMRHYLEAARLQPRDATVQYNLGLGFVRRGASDAAIACFREAVRLKPDYAHAHNNLGSALASNGELAAALEHFAAAVRSDPALFEARGNYGLALVQSGRKREALEQFRAASRLRPEDVRTRRMMTELEGEPPVRPSAPP